MSLQEDDIQFDHSKLRGKIVEVYGNVTNFANEFGLSVATMYNKLNCRYTFTAFEILKIIKLLGIDSSEIHQYFFCEKKSENL